MSSYEGIARLYAVVYGGKPDEWQRRPLPDLSALLRASRLHGLRWEVIRRSFGFDETPPVSPAAIADELGLSVDAVRRMRLEIIRHLKRGASKGALPVDPTRPDFYDFVPRSTRVMSILEAARTPTAERREVLTDRWIEDGGRTYKHIVGSSKQGIDDGTVFRIEMVAQAAAGPDPALSEVAPVINAAVAEAYRYLLPPDTIEQLRAAWLHAEHLSNPVPFPPRRLRLLIRAVERLNAEEVDAMAVAAVSVSGPRAGRYAAVRRPEDLERTAAIRAMREASLTRLEVTKALAWKGPERDPWACIAMAAAARAQRRWNVSDVPWKAKAGFIFSRDDAWGVLRRFLGELALAMHVRSALSDEEFAAISWPWLVVKPGSLDTR